MGYIYKITNPENQKCYIGKTTRDYKERWAEHKRDRFKQPYCTWHFYRMLNKVGPENVLWEVIEENVPNELIDSREQYWIEYYDSFKNGYNETTGGSKGTKYNYQDILQYWLTEGDRNFVKTAKQFGANESTISYIIKSLGYEARTPEEIAVANAVGKNRPIAQIDINTGEVINIYYSCETAAKAMGDIAMARSIWGVLNGHRPTYQGYAWQYKEFIGSPINLNKQIRTVILPEYNLSFENLQEAAKWFINNNHTRSKQVDQVAKSISYAITHSGIYQKIKVKFQNKIIYSHYKEE